MMKIRFFLSLSLIAVLVVACAPTATSTNPSAVTSESATQPASGAATAPPIATSRGPKLEATDPKTVSMASGGLQFVEFFEFW
jgi:hypothetical protein